jgi:hypothetical protein
MSLNEDNIFKKYIIYKIKYLGLLQLGGSLFTNIDINDKTLKFSTNNHIGETNKQELIKFFFLINLNVLSFMHKDKTNTITFNENLKTYEDMIREKLFKDFFLKGFKKKKLHFVIYLPWITCESRLLFIALTIHQKSNYKKILNKKLFPIEELDEFNCHMTLCQFKIRKDSNLDKQLSNKKTFEIIVDSIKNIIIDEIYGKVLNSDNTFKDFNNFFVHLFKDDIINMGFIKKKIIKKLIGKTKNKDIEICNETYRFYFNKDMKDLSDKNIRENSELIQGQYDIIKWEPHLSLPVKINLIKHNELKENLKNGSIRLIDKINLWHLDDEFNKNNEPGDFSNIKFSYTGNKNVIYVDFKKTN